jgi:hypothetical protein
MTARVIQGSFVGGGPRLSSPVAQPKAMPRLPGPPVPVFCRTSAVVQPRSARTAGAGLRRASVGGASARQRRRFCGRRRASRANIGRWSAVAGGGARQRWRRRSAPISPMSGCMSGPQAQRIGAIAFTLGSDIYFAPGRFQPETPHGQQLLGHVAHVVQQRAGGVRNPLESGLAVVQDHALEAEADRLSHRPSRRHPGKADAGRGAGLGPGADFARRSAPAPATSALPPAPADGKSARSSCMPATTVRSRSPISASTRASAATASARCWSPRRPRRVSNSANRK